MDMLAAALAYRAAGLCVLPARADEKRPTLTGWKAYQAQLPSEQQVRAFFEHAGADTGLCLITGRVSGHLELLDFDQAGELFAAWSELVHAEAPGLLERLVIERSQSDGLHVVYRCAEPVCGNIHLAQRLVITPDGDPIVLAGKTFQPRQRNGRWEVTVTLIETRGEGGLFLCAPTPGYELLQNDLAQLPVLTPQERDVLLEAAWSLNELVPTPVGAPALSDPLPAGQLRPGDDFNARGDVAALLRQHGWTLVCDGENQYWRRPGKTKGWSATLKDRVLYVFSSNAGPFEPNTAYGPFAAYAALEHGGDYSRAAQALRSAGYGTPAPQLPAPFATQPSPPPAPDDDDLPAILALEDLIARYPSLRPPIVHGLLRQGESGNIIAAPKQGKALDITTPILTDAGWRTMGELRPGMKVHTADGSLTPIVAVSEIMYDKPCYRITTKTKATLVAAGDHLWQVHQRSLARIVPTDELARGHERRRWLLPVAEALERPPVELPLDPWVLGYWLGNGTSCSGELTANVLDLNEVLAQLMAAGFRVAHIRYKGGAASFGVLGLQKALRKMGLLYCKQIPEAYLLSSRAQREALLAGLLDSDGWPTTAKNGTGSVDFTTTDEQVFWGVLFLARSLGHKTLTKVRRARLRGQDCGSALTIQIAASRNESPCRLQRRTDALPERAIGQRSRRDAIVSVEPVASVPVKCIQVAHPSGLFLAGRDLVVTHNSWLSIDLALAVATGGSWLGAFQCEPGRVLIIDNELHRETSANRIPKVCAARGIEPARVGRRISVINLRGKLRDLYALQPLIDKVAGEHFDLVICDAFYRFLPRQTDENDNGAMAGLYNLIDRYAEQTRAAFVLIHHTSKGDQSFKSITDIGAGAGAQSRAPDAHIALRHHEEEGAVVLEAECRTWPKPPPVCLRWSYPVWNPDPALDPAALRTLSGRKKKEDTPPKPTWTVEQFVEAFVTAEPSSNAEIMERAVEGGMTLRDAQRKMQIARGKRMVARTSTGDGREYRYVSGATV